MKKTLLICIFIMIFAVLASGCTSKQEQPVQGQPKQEQKDQTKKSTNKVSVSYIIQKSRAQDDVQNASIIAADMCRAFAENSISKYEENQELNSENEYGKIVGKIAFARGGGIPEPSLDKNYKFFVSVKEDGTISVSAGEKAETAVQLCPRPKEFSKPYDVLNQAASKNNANAGGNSQTNPIANMILGNSVNKSKAETDVSNAQLIGCAIIRAFTEGKITTFLKDNKIVTDSGYGKVLVENYLMPSIPSCKMNVNYKFYATVTSDGSVSVKAGDRPETAVQLYPKGKDKFKPPYDILN